MTDTGWTSTVVEAFGWVDDLAQAARRHRVLVTLTFTPLDLDDEAVLDRLAEAPT